MDLSSIPAAILAGGLGTRLRPVWADRPKVLAPVGGRPFITYLLDHLADAGIREVWLLTGVGAEHVTRALGASYGSLRLHYSVETKPLGTGGAVRRALPQIDAKRLFVLNGDSYSDVDGSLLATHHVGRNAGATLALVNATETARFGRVILDAEGWVQHFEEKKATNRAGLINAGIYLFERGVVEEISQDIASSLEHDWFPRWARQRRLSGFLASGELLDIGTPESYAQAAEFFLHDRSVVVCRTRGYRGEVGT
jgi:NDP-sugar pyrophosphorylase family protein